MTTATIPTGGRTAVLHDLTQRRNKAMDLMYAAEDAGDEQRWRRCAERFWLREIQIQYVQLMPEQSLCPQCAMGESGWQMAPLFAQEVWSCLEHWTPALEREAAAMSKAARWMGGTD